MARWRTNCYIHFHFLLTLEPASLNSPLPKEQRRSFYGFKMGNCILRSRWVKEDKKYGAKLLAFTFFLTRDLNNSKSDVIVDIESTAELRDDGYRYCILDFFKNIDIAVSYQLPQSSYASDGVKLVYCYSYIIF